MWLVQELGRIKYDGESARLRGRRQDRNDAYYEWRLRETKQEMRQSNHW